jgi:lipoprotein-anchoring transpeptidase ErfK/SrfK
MSASVDMHSSVRLPGWPARRPSGRALLIGLLAVVVGIGSRGANAVALTGDAAPAGQVAPASSGHAGDTAVLQREATRLIAQEGANPQALLATGRAALAAGRNDATIATFLALRWAARMNAGLERDGAMLTSTDVRHLALATAALERDAAQLHNGLVLDGPGQLITVSIQRQHLIAYDQGRVLVDAPVTTGRPALPTDIGAMRVLHKDSPWTMQSPWPKGTPNWYPDTVVQMVLWFTKNGEGLHDASWQPVSALGPGSQDGPFASHGCIHLPPAAVKTLFDWAPIGTPVVVYPGDGSPVATQTLQQSVDAMGNPVSGVRGA